MNDVDSYDAPRVRAGWANAQLTGPNGTVSLSELASIGLPFEKRIDLRDRGYTRFQAKVALDAASTTSDVNAAVRFFAFPRKPDYAQLLPIEGNPPVARTSMASLTQPQLIERLYRHALAREATPGEAAVAREILGNKTTPESLEDLLWVIFMNPEFQFIR
jgi:hypothetical protein